MTLKKVFLPVGLVLALVFGLLLPWPGAALYGVQLGPLTSKTACAIGVFLVMGYQIDPRDVRFGHAFIKVFAPTFVINLLLAPAVAALLNHVFQTPAGMATGLAVMACVPTTLTSSAVITHTAGGNRLWAVSMIVLLNVIGVFIVPFTLGLCLSSINVDINEWQLLTKVLLVVVAPLIVGASIRRIGGYRHFRGLDYVPSALVVTMAWMAISSSHAEIWALHPSELLLLVAIGGLLHAVLLCGSWLAARALRLPYGDAVALVFVASQKTLPIALAVLSLLALDDASLGIATVVCILYHFLQINGDSLIAALIAPSASQDSASA